MLVVLTEQHSFPMESHQCELAHSLVKAWMVLRVSWWLFSHETQCYERFWKEDSEMKSQE